MKRTLFASQVSRRLSQWGLTVLFLDNDFRCDFTGVAYAEQRSFEWSSSSSSSSSKSTGCTSDEGRSYSDKQWRYSF